MPSCYRNEKTGRRGNTIAVVIRFVDMTLGRTPQGGALSIVFRVMFLKICIGPWDST